MRAGIRTRRHAGRAHALCKLAAEPGAGEFDPLRGIVVHEMSE